MARRNLIPWRKRRRSPERFDRGTRDEFQDIFRDAMEDFFNSGWGLAPWMRRELDSVPAVDISETDKEYRVDAELPGMNKDDLNVTIDNGRLHISGERQHEDREKEGDYVRTERSYGSFSRTLSLPSTVNEDEAEADYQNGILTVRLPKTPEAENKKKIDVKASE